jgi:hypothetical protein
MHKIKVGFINAGGIARLFTCSLQALKLYYNEVPEIELSSLTFTWKPQII